MPFCIFDLDTYLYKFSSKYWFSCTLQIFYVVFIIVEYKMFKYF